MVTSIGAIALLSACVSRPGDVSSHGQPDGISSSSSAPPKGPSHLTDLISLNTTRAVAGTPIKGAFIVNNPGGTLELTDAHGCEPAYGVTLTNLSFGLPCTALPLTIKHGTNRFPVIVSTMYQGCLPPGGTSSMYMPACVDGGMPRLPPGIYHATLASLGLSLPTPLRVTVTLTH